MYNRVYMKIKDYFIPDFYFPSVLRIEPGFFVENNIRYLICDIDNTLATYESRVADEERRLWLQQVEGSGVRIGFISNNSARRVYTFNTMHGYFTESRAGKPFTRKLKRLMKQMKAEPGQTAILGDQIFTDVLCAKSAGIRAVLVMSMDVKGKPFLKMKKFFERYFMDAYYKKNNIY